MRWFYGIGAKSWANGGEYHGYVTISNIKDNAEINKEDKSLWIDYMKIEFDEVFEIKEIRR